MIPSQVHRSLLAADNALSVQSEQHPDGWGVAYYVDGSPHLTKSSEAALDCALFRRVSGIVSSETVVAHVRKATVGEKSVLNAHPFQHGKWVFAHNGEIQNFAEVREDVVHEIAPGLRRFILGDTDSEVIFFLFLSQLSRHGPLGGNFGLEETIAALAETSARIIEICDTKARGTESILNFLVTNGTTLAATRKGKSLFWSTHKTLCSDRDTCPNLSFECEHPTETGFVNHLLISSEELGGDNIWQEVPVGQVIGVDWRMRLVNRPLHQKATLPIVGTAANY